MDFLKNAFRQLEYDPDELFVLHLAFLADNESVALENADVYAEAMNLLRPEVDHYTARVSRGGDISTSVRVYCCAKGPNEGDICLNRHNHRGPHFAPGVSNDWADADWIDAEVSPPESSEQNTSEDPSAGHLNPA